jgi:hypothetical protein
VPARFTMRQQLRQWTPQFNRVTALEAAGESTGIPWDEIETSVVQSRTPKIALATLAKRHSGWDCALFNQTSDDRYFYRQENTTGKRVGGWRVKAMCVSSLHGLGQFVAGTSPGAADEFDDLALLDVDDPHEWLLVIFRETSGGVQIYRRLFRTDD